jgi:gluconolactonase
VIEMSPEGKMVRVLADKFDGIELDGPNDLVIDAKGGIYFTDPQSGTKKKKTLPGRAVFYRTPEGKVVRVTAWNETVFPNGCILSPDGKTFYLDDSGSDVVWAFDVNPDGTLAKKRAFANLVAPGKKGAAGGRSNADGMTIDTLGNIYVTAYGCIQVFDETGEFLGVIEFPEGPSNCIFGGKDMKTLYATCRDCIYSVETNVAGLSYPPR